MSCIRFRVNPHYIAAWMSRNSLLEPSAISQVYLSHLNLRYRTVLSKELLDIQAVTECGFTLKCVLDMMTTYIQMQSTDKYSQHSSVILPVWLNGWVFVYELSCCRFESCFSHLEIEYRTCLEEGLTWHSGNYWNTIFMMTNIDEKR